MTRHYSAGEIVTEKRWHPGLTFAVTVSLSAALWIGIAAIVRELI